jgi:hypothetical protein
MMPTTSTLRQLRNLAAKKRDGWDEDAADEEDEAGSSWTKVYAGGVKTRRYAAIEADQTWASLSTLP